MVRGCIALLLLLCCACAGAHPAGSPDRAMHAARWDDALAALANSERDADPRTRVALLVATSRVLLDEGLNRRANVTRAIAPAERARLLAESLGDRSLLADALDRIGMAQYWVWALGDPDSGDAPLVEAAALFARAHVARTGGAELASSHFHLGLVAEAQDRPAEARVHFTRALELAGRDLKVESYALRHLAAQDEAAGQRAIAESRLRRSLSLRRVLGWRTGIASALDALAGFLLRRGRGDEARPLLREAIGIARDAGSPYYTSRAAHTLSRVEDAAGDVAAAFAALADVRAEVSVLEAGSLRAEHAKALERLRQRCASCSVP